MRRKSAGGKIYRRRRTLKLVLSVCAGVLVFLVCLAIFLFAYFRRYIVYLPDGSGIELVVPWLEGHDKPSFEIEADTAEMQ